jgi:fructokinase
MRHKIVAIGEVLWDLLPSGKQLGGAPANFAYQAQAQGADACVIACVGADELGKLALDQLRRVGLLTDSIRVDPDLPTGTVSVALGTDGNPAYTIHEHVAWDHIVADAPAMAAVKVASAVCFGTLAQRTAPARQAIQSLVASTSAERLRVLDLNLRAPFFGREVIEESLQLANVLKLNDHELQTLATLFKLFGDMRQQMAALAQKYALKLVALTRGAQGSLLLSDAGWSDRPGQPVKVKDTIGAGDAFTAALTIGLLENWLLDEVNARASELAAYVCSQSGAMPAIPEAFRIRKRN